MGHRFRDAAFYYTDDFAPLILSSPCLAVYTDVAPNRIFSAKEALSKSLVDDQDWGGIGGIGLRQLPASEEWNLRR